MREKRDGEGGQSLVEFALVLPVLALFLLGIIDFGRIASANLVVANAARDAARYASIGDTDTDVLQVIQSDSSMLGGTVNWSINPTGTRTSGTTVTITVSDAVDVFDPFLAAILGTTYNVQSSVSMRVE